MVQTPTSLIVRGPYVMDRWVGNVRLQHHHATEVVIGVSGATADGLRFIEGRLDIYPDMTGHIVYGKGWQGFALYGPFIDSVVKDVFDAVNEMPPHGNIALYAITAIYNPLLPLLTGNPHARIPRTLTEFVEELTYKTYQRAMYITNGTRLPDRD